MSDGLLPVVKPAGPSSATIVNHAKRLTGAKRVGHSGTLDPAADGVLVLAFNRATRLFPFLISDKAYRAVIRLGQQTSTDDGQGEVLETRTVPMLQEQALQEHLQTFAGDQMQVPPMVSALHHNGKRLYDIARRGGTVERAPRPVRIHAIRFLEFRNPDLTVDVACSGGTYIRSLARDLGARLGCGAHLHRLTRTVCNGFPLDQAVSMAQFEDAVRQGTWPSRMIGTRQALAHLPAWTCDAETAKVVRHGAPISLPAGLVLAADAVVRLEDGAGIVLALARRQGEGLKMVYVLQPANGGQG